jgi:hypothetical protein
MRPGGSNSKGGTFERKIGGMLSRWLTHGERTDLFSRNVLSGGQFTVSQGKRGTPGDLIAAHPLAFRFLSLFTLELKHRANIGLAQYIMDTAHKSFLSQVIRHTETQARAHGKHYMVIAAQNHVTPIVLTSAAVGSCLEPFMRSHALHAHTVTMVHLSGLLSRNPDDFLTEVEGLRTPRLRVKLIKA